MEEKILNLTFEAGQLPCLVKYKITDVEFDIHADDHISHSVKSGEKINVFHINPIGHLPGYTNIEHCKEIKNQLSEFENEVIELLT